MELQASMGLLGAEGDCGMLSLLVPSPQSEAVTHELEELTLQPKVKLPPLNERKNGKHASPSRPPLPSRLLLFPYCLKEMRACKSVVEQ